MAILHRPAWFALLAACTGAALADDPIRAHLQADAEQARASASPFAAGLSVYLDPQTGRPVGPPVTPAQKAMAATPVASRRDDAKLTYETIPGVGVLMHTNGQMQMASYARVREDGTVDVHCIPQADPACSGSTCSRPRPTSGAHSSKARCRSRWARSSIP